MRRIHMGCAPSAPVTGRETQRRRKYEDAPFREELSSGAGEMDTTASGKNSARKAMTVWDLQQERNSRHRITRQNSMRSVTSRISESDRFSTATPRGNRHSFRDQAPSVLLDMSPSTRSLYGEPSPQASQGYIPTWQNRTRSGLNRSSSSIYTQSPARSQSMRTPDTHQAVFSAPGTPTSRSYHVNQSPRSFSFEGRGGFKPEDTLRHTPIRSRHASAARGVSQPSRGYIVSSPRFSQH